MMPLLTPKPSEGGGRPEKPDQAKALVTAELARMIEAGNATIVPLESGTLELRLATGEIFHFGDGAITRIE
jgi:hypothetical protein